MKRISNVFGTTLIVKVFPTIFIVATLLFIAVTFKQGHYFFTLLCALPLIIFLLSNPVRYLGLKEVFLDYETGKIFVSMGKLKWKDFLFDELVELTYGGMDNIIKMHFKNGDAVSFLAGGIWGRQNEVVSVKNELQNIINTHAKKQQ